MAVFNAPVKATTVSLSVTTSSPSVSLFSSSASSAFKRSRKSPIKLVKVVVDIFSLASLFFSFTLPPVKAAKSPSEIRPNWYSFSFSLPTSSNVSWVPLKNSLLMAFIFWALLDKNKLLVAMPAELSLLTLFSACCSIIACISGVFF